MKGGLRRTLLAGIAFALAGLVPAGRAGAEEQVVYWPLVSNATEYRRVPYPREAGPLLVLADSEVVIEARRAEVAFWPITREYLADFAGPPEFIAGTVEIVDAAGNAIAPTPEPYVLWYPAGVGAGPSDMVRGEEAVALHEEYVNTARASAARMLEYQRLAAESRAAVEAWARMAADDPEHPPPPPPQFTIREPEPYQAFATEPREAVVATLPEGEYTVRIRAGNGQLVPGSERGLISFASVDQGVGYVLRPGNRWTRPLVTFDPDEAVYTTGETDLFFQPVPVVEYAARRFTRLFRPQSVEVIDPSLTLWVPDESRGDSGHNSRFALWNGETKLETLERTAYRVAQKPGRTRGYEIEEFTGRADGPLEPDFVAIRVGRELPVTRMSIEGASGSGHAGSGVRAIRRVTPVPEYVLFLPALLPLAVGLAVRGLAGRLLAARRDRPIEVG